MLSATVQVAADRSATLVLDGSTTHFPDLAAALIKVGEICREAGSAGELMITDQHSTHKVHLDKSGRVTAPPEPQQSASAESRHHAAQEPHPPGSPNPTAEHDASGDSPSPYPSEPTRPPAAPGLNNPQGAEHTAPQQTTPPTTQQAAAAGVPTDDKSTTGPGGSDTPQPDSTPRAPWQVAAAADKGTGRPDSADHSATGETAPHAAASPGDSNSADHDAADGGSYPLAGRFSGPAEPTGPRARVRAARRAHAKARRRPGRHITIPGVVLLILVLIVVAAYLFPSVVGSPTADSPATEGTHKSQGEFSSLSVENATTPVPGFAKTPAWTSEVDKNASVTASARGVLVVTKKRLRVIDPTTGKQRYAEDLHGDAIDFAVDTTVSGQKALLWRSGQTAKALFDSAKKPVTYKLPQGARLSSAGSSVLMKVGNGLFTFGDRGLKKVPLPPSGTTPMALDDDTLISAAFGGPVYLTDIGSGKQRKPKLESPGKGLQIIRWISAGYGNVVTLWGKPGSQTNSGHSVQLVIHNAKTGAIKSTVSTSTDVVSDNTKWVRGQGHKLAVIGRYLFDMRSGLLMRESSSQHVQFSDPRGTLTPGTLNGESVLVSGDTAWKTTTNLLAVTDKDELAIVRQGDGAIVAYPKS